MYVIRTSAGGWVWVHVAVRSSVTVRSVGCMGTRLHAGQGGWPQLNTTIILHCGMWKACGCIHSNSRESSIVHVGGAEHACLHRIGRTPYTLEIGVWALKNDGCSEFD